MADHKGKPPWNMLCDSQKGTNPAYRDGYDRTFGKKPLPHGRDRLDAEDDALVGILADMVAEVVGQGEDRNRFAGSA